MNTHTGVMTGVGLGSVFLAGQNLSRVCTTISHHDTAEILKHKHPYSCLGIWNILSSRENVLIPAKKMLTPTSKILIRAQEILIYTKILIPAGEIPRRKY